MEEACDPFLAILHHHSKFVVHEIFSGQSPDKVAPVLLNFVTGVK